jgi:hypothetical protein
VASHAWLVGATGGFEEVGNLDPGYNKRRGRVINNNNNNNLIHH